MSLTFDWQQSELKCRAWIACIVCAATLFPELCHIMLSSLHVQARMPAAWQLQSLQACAHI